MQRHFNVLSVFGFNSAKYELKLLKSHLLLLLVKERGIDPILTKKANQFVSFKFGDVWLLDILNFLGRAASVDSFRQAYKTLETKVYFQMSVAMIQKCTQLPLYENFIIKLLNNNPLQKDYSDVQIIIDGCLISKEALLKFKLSQPPPTGDENYEQLISVWQQENMCTFKDFLRWHNNEDVVPKLVTMQKMVDFYHSKGTDI